LGEENFGGDSSFNTDGAIATASPADLVRILDRWQNSTYDEIFPANSIDL
jgi:hypothetical protein